MEPTRRKKIETLFETLPPESKAAIIVHGVALYQSMLKKRLVLAQAKIQQFEAKYQISLSQLDNNGLPEDANYEMHEDYIMWHHWNDTIEKANDQISLLEKIADNSLNVNEAFHVSC
ncbi:MAG TPA: hypothetical protein VGD14_01445 [bacterium]